MDFTQWFNYLILDAAKTGCLSRLRKATTDLWPRIYAEGVEPKITAVCQWATEDPERFLDLRETECDHQLAA